MVVAMTLQPSGEVERQKCYAAWKAVEAMYELRRQGFTNPTTILRELENGQTEQWLICDMKDDGSCPDIDIDEVAYWANPQGRIPHIASVCNENEQYWWVFD